MYFVNVENEFFIQCRFVPYFKLNLLVHLENFLIINEKFDVLIIMKYY